MCVNMLCRVQTQPGTSVKMSTVISVSGVLSSAADTAGQKEKNICTHVLPLLPSFLNWWSSHPLPSFPQADIQNDFTSFPGQPNSMVRTGISTKVKPHSGLLEAQRVTSSCPQSPWPLVCSCHSRWPCLFLPEKCLHLGSSPFLRNRLISPEQFMWSLRHCHFLPLSFSTTHFKLVLLLYLMKILKVLLS